LQPAAIGVPALRAAQNTTNFDIITPDGCRDLGEYLGISVIWPQDGRLKNNGMGYGEQRILHIGTTHLTTERGRLRRRRAALV
jgi:hypothetical protein